MPYHTPVCLSWLYCRLVSFQRSRASISSRRILPETHQHTHIHTRPSLITEGTLYRQTVHVFFLQLCVFILLPTYLPTYLPTTCPPTELSFSVCLFCYLPTYLPTYQPTNQPTYLPLARLQSSLSLCSHIHTYTLSQCYFCQVFSH